MGHQAFNRAGKVGISVVDLVTIAQALNIPLPEPEQLFAKAGTNGPTIVGIDHVLKGRGERIDPEFFSREAAVQGFLAENGLPVPVVTHRGKDYFVMERVQGDMLLRDWVDALPQDQQQKLTDRIGDFIHSMARVLDGAAGQAVLGDAGPSPCFFSHDKIETRIQAALAAELITPETAELIKTAHQEYSDAITRGELTAIPYHADLNGSNILFDAPTDSFTIIDFGSVHRGPVSECLATMHQCFSPDFVQGVANSYAQKSGTAVAYRHIAACSAFLSLDYMIDRATDPMGDPEGVKRYHTRLLAALHEIRGVTAIAGAVTSVALAARPDA